MAEQHLDDADIGAVLEQMRGEAVPERVDRHPLVDAGGGPRRAAGRIQHLHVDGAIGVPAGKQPALRLRQTPVDPQDAQKLRRQHHGAVLAALAMLDTDHPATAVDVADLQPDGLRGTQAGGVGRGQGRARLQARHRLQKANNLVGAQHHRQRARRAGIDDPLRNLGMAQRHAVEEPQRAHRLVQRRPRNPVRHQMHLEGANILQAEPVRRAAEVTGKLRHRMHVGSLRGRRQIADRHVLDHAPAKRAQLGHLIAPVSRLRFNSRNPSKQKLHPQTDPPNAASAASFNRF